MSKLLLFHGRTHFHLRNFDNGARRALGMHKQGAGDHNRARRIYRKHKQGSEDQTWKLIDSKVYVTKATLLNWNAG